MCSLKFRPLTMVAPHIISVQIHDVADSLLRSEAGSGFGGFKATASSSDPDGWSIVLNCMALDLLGLNCIFISGS